MLEAQLETQEILLKKKTAERKEEKPKPKSREPASLHHFQISNPKSSHILCNLGAKISVHCLYKFSYPEKEEAKKEKENYRECMRKKEGLNSPPEAVTKKSNFLWSAKSQKLSTK
jgi:hypothetical protein